MMTWEIFLGICALLGFTVSVMTPIVKLVKTIDAIDLTLASLRETISNVINDNKKMYNDIEELFDKVDHLERRVTKIEIERDLEHRQSAITT